MTDEQNPSPLDFSNVSLSSSQVATLYADLLATAPEEAKANIIAAAAKDGVTDLTAAKVDPTTNEAKFAAFLAPAASPFDYQIQYDDARSVTPEIAASFRENFHLAGVPIVQADGLANSFLASERHYPDTLAEPARVLAMRSEGYRVTQLSNSAELIRLAHLGANALPPAFMDKLYASKALHTAEAWIQLAALGGVIEARGK